MPGKDYKRQREREALEAAEHEANTFAAMAEFGSDELFEDDDDGEGLARSHRKKSKLDKKDKKDKKKNRKRRKQKDKHLK
jgi:hypothetical protein